MEYQQIIILSNNTPIKQLHFGEKIGLKLMTMQVENIKLIGKLNLKLQYQSQVHVILVISTYLPVELTFTWEVNNDAANSADERNNGIILKTVHHLSTA